MRKLWAGIFISRTGSQLWKVALPWFVWTDTGSALHLALAVIAPLAPTLLLGSVASRLADRFDRRRAMVGLEVSRGALFTVMAIGFTLGNATTSDPLVLTALYLLAATDAFAEIWFVGARNGVIKALASDGYKHSQLNGLHSAVNGAASAIGFLGAGASLASLSDSATFGINGLTFIVSAALIASSSVPSGTTGVSGRSGGVVAASRRLLKSSGLRLAATSLVAINTLVPFAVVMMPVLAETKWGGALWLGGAHVAFQVGGLVASSVRVRGRVALKIPTELGVLTLAALIILSLLAAAPIAMITLAGAGAAGTWIAIDASSDLQRFSGPRDVGSNAVTAGVWATGAAIVVPAVVATFDRGAIVTGAVIAAIVAGLGATTLVIAARVFGAEEETHRMGNANVVD